MDWADMTMQRQISNKTGIAPDSLLTSYQVGSLLQVNPSSVNKWVKEGRIPAFRTPGGHRRIRARDLVSFLTQHEMPIPHTLAAASRLRLLMVDDDTRQLEAASRLLLPVADQIELQTTDNGMDALILVGSFKPHIVILDIFMPGLDGLEVCRRLKAQPNSPTTQVILTSAQMNATLAEQCRKAGANTCQEKPLTREVFEQLLDPQPGNDTIMWKPNPLTQSP